MKSKTAHSLIVCLILTVGYLSPAQAVSDAELEALEKQIEQLESEEKKQAEITDKKKAEMEKKRLSELEKQRQEEQRLLEEEKDKLEQEKRKLEEARQTELDRKQQEKEAKQFALEEQKRKEEEAAKARVTIVFFRLSKFVSSLHAVPLAHNDSYIGTLQNGSFFIYTSPTGTQTIYTDTESSGYSIDKTFEFESEQTYYIQLLVTPAYSFKLIPQAEGRNAIENLKNVGKINPADVLSDYDESEDYQAKKPQTQRAPL